MEVRNSLIRNNIGKSLNVDEIQKLCDCDFYLITRDDIKNMYEIFDEDQNEKIFFLIHYETNILPNGAKNGHWCGMYINKYYKKVYFFDSYGFIMDNSRKYIDNQYLISTGQNHKYISKFVSYLQKKGYKAYYNEIKFQKMNDAIATCGRYIALFFKYFDSYHNASLRSFQKLLLDLPKKNGIKDNDKFKYDKAVTISTI